MSQKKYKKFKDSPNKIRLYQMLWFIENYLPKKDQNSQKKIAYE